MIKLHYRRPHKDRSLCHKLPSVYVVPKLTSVIADVTCLRCKLILKIEGGA